MRPQVDMRSKVFFSYGIKEMPKWETYHAGMLSNAVIDPIPICTAQNKIPFGKLIFLHYALIYPFSIAF